MDDFNDKALSLKVQNHQFKKAGGKVSDLHREIGNVNVYQGQTADEIKQLSKELASLDFDGETVDELDLLLLELDLELISENNIPKLQRIEKIEFDHLLNDQMDWSDYVASINEYSKRNQINPNSPFEGLLTKSQEAALKNRIQKEFTFKAPNCDKYDYLIAGTSGLLCGLIDVFFVGAPGDSPLGNEVDKFANSATEKFAKYLGWDSDKAAEKGSNTTASAIGFLERKFKINYDQATTSSVGGAVDNLSLKNHHLKSFGHSPDIIGLFFSVLNQFTSKSTFISNGEITTVDTENFELQGSTFISKVFCGIANWFGHIMSDWTGSSGTVGQGGRGAGVPIPFYNLFLGINAGEFGDNKQSIATIATKVFEQGYDARHGLTMAIPVVLNELIIRLSWVIKARFFHQKDWSQCIPSDSNPELRRMLCVGQGALCLVDGVDATIRGGGEPVSTLLRMNLLAWTRFAHLSLKELNAWVMQGKIDHGKIDAYLDDEFEKQFNSNYARGR